MATVEEAFEACKVHYSGMIDGFKRVKKFIELDPEWPGDVESLLRFLDEEIERIRGLT